MSSALRVLPLTPAREADFARLHAGEAGWCRCVAWWVEEWAGWGERSADENLGLRTQLFGRGEHDGYLLYEGSEPLAWAQVGPRDRLIKLVRQFDLGPDPEAWAVTCLQVAPAARGRGLARRLVAEVVADLRRRRAAGEPVARIEAFPKADPGLPAHEQWTGPASVYAAAGFTPWRPPGPNSGGRAVYRLELKAPAGA